MIWTPPADRKNNPQNHNFDSQGSNIVPPLPPNEGSSQVEKNLGESKVQERLAHGRQSLCVRGRQGISGRRQLIALGLCSVPHRKEWHLNNRAGGREASNTNTWHLKAASRTLRQRKTLPGAKKRQPAAASSVQAGKHPVSKEEQGTRRMLQPTPDTTPFSTIACVDKCIAM